MILVKENGAVVAAPFYFRKAIEQDKKCRRRCPKGSLSVQ